MLLFHDVMVLGIGLQTFFRKRVGKKRGKWKRVFNTMDAFAALLLALCGFKKEDSLYDILACHLDSIRALYAVAKVLRIVFNSQAIQVIENSVQGAERTAIMCIAGTKESMELYEEEGTLKYIRKILFPTQSHKKASHLLCMATYTIPMYIY